MQVRPRAYSKRNAGEAYQQNGKPRGATRDRTMDPGGQKRNKIAVDQERTSAPKGGTKQSTPASACHPPNESKGPVDTGNVSRSKGKTAALASGLPPGPGNGEFGQSKEVDQGVSVGPHLPQTLCAMVTARWRPPAATPAHCLHRSWPAGTEGPHLPTAVMPA